MHWVFSCPLPPWVPVPVWDINYNLRICLRIICHHSLHTQCALQSLCVVHVTGFHSCVLTHTPHVKYPTVQFHSPKNPVCHLFPSLSLPKRSTVTVSCLSPAYWPFPGHHESFFFWGKNFLLCKKHVQSGQLKMQFVGKGSCPSLVSSSSAFTHSHPAQVRVWSQWVMLKMRR